MFTAQTMFGQGTIRGKITDSNGESLVGATVLIRESPTTGTITDFDGNYSLETKTSGTVTLSARYISYQTIEQSVEIGRDKVTIVNFEMQQATTELEDVVITSKANRESDTYMRKVKINSAISMDYISKETIQKIGDSRVDDAIKRVTGVSSVGGFVTVRGLADRYVVTSINGTRIPTLDPLTNNIKLDMFPTSLIDNLIISKTLSPDIPNNWAGAYLSIETKDYPQSLSINIQSSFGFNKQTTFQNIVSSPRSSTDWLGFDNGFRDITHHDVEDFPFYDPIPSAFDEFASLGLEDYMTGVLGINESHLNNPTGFYHNNIYYRLGLIQLGLLPPGLIYSDEEVANAILQYQNGIKQDAFQTINRDTEAFGTSMSNSWLTTRRTAPVEYSQDFSIGNQISLFGRPLGLLAGIRYSSSVKSDPNSKVYHYEFIKSLGQFFANTSYVRENSVETNGWSALLNASYKISPNHSISLTYMPNMAGINMARVDSGYSASASAAYDFLYVLKHDQRYEERQQMVYQARSTHYLPMVKLRADFTISYTDGESSSPDYRQISYGGIDTVNYSVYKTPAVFHPSREYRRLDEDILDAFAKFEMPFFEKPGLPRKLGFGLSYFLNTRSSSQHLYYLRGTSGNDETTDIENYLRTELFQLRPARDGRYYIPIYYTYEYSDVDFGLGSIDVRSAYGMTDFSINPTIRVAGGLRIEQSTIFSDILKYHEAGYPAGDLRRLFPLGSGPSGLNNKTADPANIEGLDVLPSVNVIFKVRDNQSGLSNIRLNFSKSVVRPSVREVSPFWAFDYEQSTYLIGNPNLKATEIDNFDLRFESFSPNEANYSISLFYKDFKNHIELSNEGNITWRNAESGEAWGIEIEGKKEIISNLTAGANITYVYSNSLVNYYNLEGGIDQTINRQMYGQAPYIINGLLSYSSSRTGLSATATYNVQGPRLALASRFSSIPDVYELPMHAIDLKISKELGKHFSVALKVRNLLNASTTRAHDGDGEFFPSWSKDNRLDNLKYTIKDIFTDNKRYSWDYTYDSYTYGTTFVVSVGYKL
jgi:hypothetical protein